MAPNDVPRFEPNSSIDVADVVLQSFVPRMKRAVQFYIAAVVRKLQVAQPTRSVSPRTPGHQPYRVGMAPSMPGEPPKKVTGRLADSITGRTEVNGDGVVGLVGTNVEYARRLELGFVGTDAAGRSVNQQPRPYLRNTGIENRAKIIDILNGKA